MKPRPPGELDGSYPIGDPEAVLCRHCQTGRCRHHGVLLCTVCDHPAELIRSKPEETTT